MLSLLGFQTSSRVEREGRTRRGKCETDDASRSGQLVLSYLFASETSTGELVLRYTGLPYINTLASEAD